MLLIVYFLVMNLENRAFNGCRITYSRDVSPHMQLKHTFSLDSAESKAYSYLSEVAFGSGYRVLYFIFILIINLKTNLIFYFFIYSSN